ncbi:MULTISPECIES: hypothetical protein [Bacillus]|uniref:hypothetical protein n=1 Tax=Bacillus TaxID=1386 RepID=UPI0008FB19CF|nr:MULTISPECIES: hypothetical protein [Bacillus]ARC72615.1 hypothetical protein B37_00562 [Bacillus licheniformis]ARW56600.1 hypothetical protein S100027_04636 [Bacillus licheniformis]AXF87869.1 hypothetical protein BLDA23_06090 [Bacillus licheniformis]KAA6475827.1 hypothetical protein DX928_06895 [Bacillus swezeyi]OIS75763.1 hypothetical protein A4A38_10755 [Bacillus licheniformis]
MEFKAEVINSNVKTKKDKDYKYKVTVVTLETMRLDPDIVNMVNSELNVSLHDVDFVAELTGVTVAIKKINKIPVRYFKVKLEFEGTNDEISRLVNKSVDAVLAG